jgi:hypothetical protein
MQGKQPVAKTISPAMLGKTHTSSHCARYRARESTWICAHQGQTCAHTRAHKRASGGVETRNIWRVLLQNERRHRDPILEEWPSVKKKSQHSHHLKHSPCPTATVLDRQTQPPALVGEAVATTLEAWGSGFRAGALTLSSRFVIVGLRLPGVTTIALSNASRLTLY